MHSLVSGQQGKESPGSDLDFHIVVDSDEGWNYKKFINGVPVEAYFLPQNQWRKLIDESPHVPTSFATGTIVYDTDSCLHELSAYAKKNMTRDRQNYRICKKRIGESP